MFRTVIARGFWVVLFACVPTGETTGGAGMSGLAAISFAGDRRTASDTAFSALASYTTLDCLQFFVRHSRMDAPKRLRKAMRRAASVP